LKKYAKIKVEAPEWKKPRYFWVMPLGTKKIKILGTMKLYMKVNDEGEKTYNILALHPENVLWEKEAKISRKYGWLEVID